MAIKRKTSVVIATLAIVLAGGSGLVGTGHAIGADVEKREDQLKELRERIKEISSTLEGDKGKMDQASRELRGVEKRIGEASTQLRLLDNNLKRQQELIADLRTKENRQAKELDSHRGLLSTQMLAAYAMGKQERVKVILNQEDPAQLGRMLQYHAYLGAERTKRIELIREILERLRETKETISKEEFRLAELKGQAEQQKAGLEKDKVEREKVMSDLRKEISDKDKELEKLQRDAKFLTKLIASLQNALSDIPTQSDQNKSFDSMKGKMSWPTQGEVVAEFDSPRETGVNWDGVYIAATEGREVKAIHQGRVSYAEWLRGFGLVIIIDHGNGYMSVYGHNQGLLKEVGDWVTAGEAIALVGSSGGQNKSGIYFAVRHKGRPVDPSIWCRQHKGNRLGIWLKPHQRTDRPLPVIGAKV